MPPCIKRVTYGFGLASLWHLCRRLSPNVLCNTNGRTGDLAFWLIGIALAASLLSSQKLAFSQVREKYVIKHLLGRDEGELYLATFYSHNSIDAYFLNNGMNFTEKNCFFFFLICYVKETVVNISNSEEIIFNFKYLFINDWGYF